jgi:hypothetical protein
MAQQFSVVIWTTGLVDHVAIAVTPNTDATPMCRLDGVDRRHAVLESVDGDVEQGEV